MSEKKEEIESKPKLELIDECNYCIWLYGERLDVCKTCDTEIRRARGEL